MISRAALDVVRGLQEAGFDGYLVGGCVRDLLLDRRPKDFDVTTNATPEQVRRIFRRARIIGRRFRLVHVRHGREVVEVATYRANPAATRASLLPWKNSRPRSAPRTTEEGRLLDDNVYGSMEDDALRRDFTVNAIYYDPLEERIVDFLGGVRDIRAQRLCLIGKPAERFAEDPVRMLRVVRFKAKLGLEPERGLMKAVGRHRSLLSSVPPARLFDEVLKLFHHAHGVASWEELRTSGFADILFPRTVAVLDAPGGERWETLVLRALENTDRRISQNKPVIAAFLYAVLLWRPFGLELETAGRGAANHSEWVWQAGDRVFAEQCRQVAVPRRISSQAIEIWQLQGSLERRRPRSVQPMLDNKRFRAAYDFLLLRASIGEIPQELAAWWTRIQNLGPREREETIRQLSGTDPNPGKRGRRRRPRRRPAVRQASGQKVG